MRYICFCLVVLVVFSGTITVAQEAELHVDAGQILGEISPYVYGVNYTYGVVPPDLMPQAKASGLKFLQYGGNIIEEIGVNLPYIDLVMLLAEQLEAEVTIAVPVHNGTVEDALEALQYTIDKGYDVGYWTIGDEPNLFDDYTTAQYNEDWRAIAEAMLAIEPDIQFIGPDLSQYPPDPERTPRDKDGNDWLRDFLLANGDLVSVVSVHRFPFPMNRNDPPTTVEQLRANAREWDTIIPNVRAVIQEATGRDIPIAINGFSSHYTATLGTDASQDSHFNAIWLADVLGRMIRQGVFMASYFDLQSNDARGGSGLMSRYEMRPSYYTYVMYKQFGSRLVEASSSDDDVTIYAALNDDGALTLMVVNLASEESTRTLQLNNFTPGGAAQVWGLDSDHNAEQIEDVELSDGVDITVPAQSMTLYVLPAS